MRSVGITVRSAAAAAACAGVLAVPAAAVEDPGTTTGDRPGRPAAPDRLDGDTVPDAPEPRAFGPSDAYGLALAGGAALTVGGLAVRRRRAARAARSRCSTAG